MLVPARLGQEAQNDPGQLPKPMRDALEQAGLLCVVVDEARAESLMTGLVEPPPAATSAGYAQRSAEGSPPRVTQLVATFLNAGQSWSMLHSGSRSASPWPLVMEQGVAVVQPAGQLRLLGRSWMVPGPALEGGEPGLSGEVMIDLVPYLAGALGPGTSASSLSLEPTRLSTLADRGAALVAQRVTIVLPRGRALVLAPIALERDAPLGATDELRAGEVTRRSGPPLGGADLAIAPRRPIGPVAQKPLRLGEALLSDASPATTARSATLIVLTAQGPGRFAILGPERGQ
jgi:hypothetical protein